MSTQEHWNQVYSTQETTKLGWYEEEPKPSIILLKKCCFKNDDQLLIVGAGVTTLVDYLIHQKFNHVIATDISPIALNTLRNRLGKIDNHVRLLQDDFTNPLKLDKLRDIGLWHDRAVLHFLVDPKDQLAYFKLLQTVLRPDGYVIIAAFALTGVQMCSGLPVKNYSSDMLAQGLGPDFKLIESFDWIHTMPNGAERDYVYTLFQRVKGG